MKIDLSKIDREMFDIKSQDGLNLVTPKGFGVLWSKDNLKFCSSIWNDEGELVSASFPKFFNWGEAANLSPVPTDLKSTLIIEKKDGSTLCVSKYYNELIIRTRGTFEAKTQANGFEIDILKSKYSEAFANKYLDTYSLLFEWVSPNNRIVLQFDEVDIYLIGMIDHSNYRLVSQDKLDEVAIEIGVDRPKVFKFADIGNLLSDVKLFKGIEGVCVYSDGGQTIHKVKGDDYLARHKLKSEVGSYEKLVDWIFSNCLESAETGVPRYAEVLVKLEAQIDYETMMECKSGISKIIDAMKLVQNILNGFWEFVVRIKTYNTRKAQAESVLQAYGNTNRCGMVFKLLDKKPLSKDELKNYFGKLVRGERMKAYVVKCGVLDFEEQGVEHFKEQFENTDFNMYSCVNIYETEEIEIGEWSDEHPLNKLNVSEEVLNDYRRKI